MAPRLHDEIPDKFGGQINAGALAAYVERVSRVMVQQKELADAIKNICAEADEAGVASKREIRRLARESQMEPDVLRQQLQRMADLRCALGEFEATPLGQSAMQRADPNGATRADNIAAATAAAATRAKPKKKFAEQPVTPPRRRGRPQKAQPPTVDEALASE